MTGQTSSHARFDHPPSLDTPAVPGLANAVVEATRMREMKLAELQSFVDDLQAEQGPASDEELRAIRDEWLG